LSLLELALSLLPHSALGNHTFACRFQPPVCFRLPFGRPPRRLRRHPSRRHWRPQKNAFPKGRHLPRKREGNLLRNPLTGERGARPYNDQHGKPHRPQKVQFRVCFRLPFGRPPRQIADKVGNLPPLHGRGKDKQ
jgi:hypothetical protein